MDSRELVDYWDDHTEAWLNDDDPLPEPLKRWWESYQATGDGKPTRECFAEPYIGAFARGVTVAMLGLNPGQAFPELQARTGLFADEIRSVGSYSRWAAPNPYLGDTWQQFANRRNRYHSARQRFAERWLDDPSQPARVLTLELYPWHSTRVTAAMSPPSKVINDFVWEPLADLQLDLVFAFGRPWVDVCERLKLRALRSWRTGDPDFPFAVPSRVVCTYELPTGGQVVVSSQSVYAGPPGREDALRLREILTS